jgi:ATP-dependent Clp protease ATP-binding subunit ClpA
MWQRFTERARRVVFFAQEEATQLGQKAVGDEHLLLGLIREDDTLAVRILRGLGVNPLSLRTEVMRQVTYGPGDWKGDMQLTPTAKRVIDLAYEETKELQNDYIGTSHLLLGLLRAQDGLVGRLLAETGVSADRVRDEIRKAQAEAEATRRSRSEALDISVAGLTAAAAGATPEQSTEPDPLFPRLNGPARMAIFFAGVEATRRQGHYVGPEHLLLALLRDEPSVTARVLDGLGVSRDRLHSEVERQIARGPGYSGQELQFTPRAKRTLDLAFQEARLAQHRFTGTGHLLLGLLAEGDGLAARLLAQSGADLTRARRLVAAHQSDENQTDD